MNGIHPSVYSARGSDWSSAWQRLIKKKPVIEKGTQERYCLRGIHRHLSENCHSAEGTSKSQRHQSSKYGFICSGFFPKKCKICSVLHNKLQWKGGSLWQLKALLQFCAFISNHQNYKHAPHCPTNPEYDDCDTLQSLHGTHITALLAL